MSQADVLNIAQEAMVIALKLTAPLLLTSLVIGVVISVFQAVTSVQEMTLTFVPKLAGIALVLVVAGNWMLGEITAYTRDLFLSIPRLVGA